MNSNDKKIFRDPIYGLISFSKEKEKVILDLIDTREFQRLRRIRQLGVSWVTYPSSLHDRFCHSIGVAYNLKVILEYLNVPEQVEIDGENGLVKISREEVILLIQVAGLLHDIGHGPFSHAFEKIAKFEHEKMTIRIIRDEKSEINQVLRNIINVNLRENLLNWLENIIQGTIRPLWIKELISSQVDADRMDYLLRDAYMCGVNYASFDWQWLLNNMEIGTIPQEDNREGILINAQKGIFALESFIISRYHMYEQVYYHKTTRGIEILISKIFERIKELIDRKETNSNDFINESLFNFLHNPENIANFYYLDDFFILSQINIWADYSKDPILSELCKAIKYRKPFKNIKESINDQLYSRQEYKEINQKNFSGDEEKMNYFFFEDNYLNNPYKDTYLLGKDTAEEAGHIWLIEKQSNSNITELAEKSDIIKALRNNITKRYRAYMHRDYIK